VVEPCSAGKSVRKSVRFVVPACCSVSALKVWVGLGFENSGRLMREPVTTIEADDCVVSPGGLVVGGGV
jgi:hypothetical protein